MWELASIPVHVTASQECMFHAVYTFLSLGIAVEDILFTLHISPYYNAINFLHACSRQRQSCWWCDDMTSWPLLSPPLCKRYWSHIENTLGSVNSFLSSKKRGFLGASTCNTWWSRQEMNVNFWLLMTTFGYHEVLLPTVASNCSHYLLLVKSFDY